MVSSRLSLKASVVREQMFFTCNQGLVTPVMMTGMLGVQESALEAWDYPTVTLTRDTTVYHVIGSYDILGIVLHGHRISCHIIPCSPMNYPIWSYTLRILPIFCYSIFWYPMYCPTWLPYIMSYYFIPSYELSYMILYHHRLSLMVSSRLSLEASVVRENMFSTCNRGLVTKVMVTGRMGVQESALEE